MQPRPPSHRVAARLRSARLHVVTLALVALLLFPHSVFAHTIYTTDIPGPAGSGNFGSFVLVLSNGNIAVADPGYDLPNAVDVGAVFLYKRDSLELISVLTGSSTGDAIGSGGGWDIENATYRTKPLYDLGNGSFVVVSPNWHNRRGAITQIRSDTGLSGVISLSNSLVGSSEYCPDISICSQNPGDYLGGGFLQVLSNGNYIVGSPTWNYQMGAATFVNGVTGLTGEVSETNSLVGIRQWDYVGNAITLLANGNYVLPSGYEKGAVTWGSATSGHPVGVATAANSLIGTEGSTIENFIVPLTNGNYVVVSPFWSNGQTQEVGAVTWGNGQTGTTGVVSVANSLVGARASDQIGREGGYSVSGPYAVPGVIPLTNGNYVVISPYVDTAARTDVGAVTLGNGTTGTTGLVSAANSLVGSRDMDYAGYAGVVALKNGNYVVLSPLWDNGSESDAGAVTWGNGATGVKGSISASNSLVGSAPGDMVGHTGTSAGIGSGGVAPLPNGNYVVLSPKWAGSRGAATWANGTTGITGTISESNSLIADTNSHSFGYYPQPSSYGNHGRRNVTILSNGNYVIASPYWYHPDLGQVGAITWGNGAVGTSGIVSTTNSLVGSTWDDRIGELDFENPSVGVFPLTNGKYVVTSPSWDNGGEVDAGAVICVDGSTAATGVVTTTNTIHGMTANDKIGIQGATVLANGNYVISSPNWSNPAGETMVGAVTWGKGDCTTLGGISVANSWVGLALEDMVGSGGVVALTNGAYAIHSPDWDNGASSFDVGAVTWASGGAPGAGTISASNSIVGSSPLDRVGEPLRRIIGGGPAGPIYQELGKASTPMNSGDFMLFSPSWSNGSEARTAAVTWGNGATGTVGPVSGANSALGFTADQGNVPDAYVPWRINYQSANNDQRVIVGRTFDNIVTVLDLVPPPNKIVVQKAGNGGGSVTSTPAGISCGATCAFAFANGASVTLTATPAVGSTFLGWAGPCSGTGATCTVTASKLHLVSASFGATSFPLTVTKGGAGSGSVTSDPEGIDCGSTCTATFAPGAEVSLTAQPASGSLFSGWSGACSGTEPYCTVTMNQASAVTANFALESTTPQFTLTVTKAGSGTGTVTSTPSGIACGSDCSEGFAQGTTVTLAATPASGSVFTGWSGACSGTGACQVTMNQAHNVTATFAPGTAGKHQLIVNKTGSGSGTVTSAPAGITCGSTCAAEFDQNASVTLTATPMSGSTFAGWSGACSGTGACVVTMSGTASVTATFTTGTPPNPNFPFQQVLPAVRK